MVPHPRGDTGHPQLLHPAFSGSSDPCPLPEELIGPGCHRGPFLSAESAPPSRRYRALRCGCRLPSQRGGGGAGLGLWARFICTVHLRFINRFRARPQRRPQPGGAAAAAELLQPHRSDPLRGTAPAAAARPSAHGARSGAPSKSGLRVSRPARLQRAPVQGSRRCPASLRAHGCCRPAGRR